MSRSTKGNEGRYDKTANLVFEDARIIFRNFRGEDYGYNPQHKKSFSVLLDPNEFDVEAMREDGWNVKQMKPREGYEDETNFHLPVEVRWDNFPPAIWLITQSGEKEDGTPTYKRTRLDEESSFVIDTAEIAKVNVEISHGRTYEFNGKTGIKAYLKKMYVELVQDRFDTMYDWDDEDSPF